MSIQWSGRTQQAVGDAESLFDVETDPGETDDLSVRRPELAQTLREVLQTWRRQLAYYQFPMYYERYFPPWRALDPHAGTLIAPGCVVTGWRLAGNGHDAEYGIRRTD